MPLQGAEIVRIECHGCRSTLEVGVPFSCIRSAEPVVVRCGACVTLLQVRITLQPSIPNEEEFNFDGSIPSDLSHDLTLPAEHLRQLHQQSQNQQHDSGLHPEDESDSMQHDIASAFAPFPKGIWQPPAQGYSNSAEPLNLDFMARCGPLRNIQSDPGISSPPLSAKPPMTDVQEDQHSQEHQPLKTKCKAAKSSANDCAINRPAAHGGVEQNPRRAKQTPYNKFMSEEIWRLKKQGIDHKTAFRMASQGWKHHPDNAANRSRFRGLTRQSTDTCRSGDSAAEDDSS